MASDAKVLTTVGFLDHFMEVEERITDRSFVFVLGAGASKQSGIPTAWELVERWLKELQRQHDPECETRPLKEWATAQNLAIRGFEYDQAASFYPQVYKRRFGPDPDSGYAYLESVVEGREPSFGYSVLAQILDRPRHRCVITTNFDNLVADGLSLYGGKYPLVCGHESLAQFVRVRMRRPVVAKIHRDLLLAPKSDPDEIEELAPEWKDALRNLFEFNCPIFIGYGGNDGSLMGFLEELGPQEISGRPIWCYYEPGGLPSERIRELVVKLSGVFVPILGFDQLMLQLSGRLNLPLMDGSLQEQAKERAERYRKSFEKLQAEIAEPAPAGDIEAAIAKEDVRRVVSAAADRATGWWAWHLKAKREPDPERREQIYREGLEKCPDSPELMNNFALFLLAARNEHDEAEKLYRRAMELDQENARIVGNFALFVQKVRKDYDEAEKLHRRALELDPEDSAAVADFATFLFQVRKEYDEAEKLYRLALELDPRDARIVSNIGIFVRKVRKNYDEAEKLHRRALELDPGNAHVVNNLATFVWQVRKNWDEAEMLYRRALELDPEDADIMGNLAAFLWLARKADAEAEPLFRRAVQLQPEGLASMGNLATFLWQVRKDWDGAEKLYRRALDLDPGRANENSNFTAFLLARGRNAECAEQAQRSWEICKVEELQATAEVALYRGIMVRMDGGDDAPALGRLKTLLEAGLQRGHWSFDEILAAVEGKLSKDDNKLYGALADAILDESKVAELDKFPRWKEIEPISLDEPWPEEES